MNLWRAMTNLLSAPTNRNGDDTEAVRTHLIEAEQVRLLYTYAPTALLSNILSTAALLLGLQDTIAPSLLFSWAAFIGAVTLARALLVYSYKRRDPALDTIHWWRRSFILGAGATGVAWFIAGALLFSGTSLTHQFVLLFILYANAAGSMAFLSPVYPAFLAFFLPVIAVTAFHVTTTSHMPVVMGALSLFYIVAFASIARQFSASVIQSLQLRFHNLALVQNLKVITERFELAVRGSNEGLWDAAIFVAAPGRFIATNIYYSPRFKNLLGFTETDFPDTLASWRTRLHPEDHDRVMRALHEHLAHKTPYALEYRMLTKTGEQRWFNGGGQAVWDAADNPIRMAGSLQDITARKHAELLKDELVSTVSHELRTPLTSLRGFAELMLSRSFPEEKQRQFLSIIHQEATRLTNLINDFLDLQRMESGRQVYEFTTTPLTPLVRDALSVFINAPGKHAFFLDLTDDLPLVRVDADRIRQVLTNLLSNAVKYSPQGGPISVGARHDGSQATVWVADHGLGIPQDVQPQLFSKFFRVNNQETRSIGGTGLGLALVKEVVEAHDGRVWVKSTEGQGSTFFFSLPALLSTAADEERSTVSL
jgi:PAS domain S-box-containing protein